MNAKQELKQRMIDILGDLVETIKLHDLLDEYVIIKNTAIEERIKMWESKLPKSTEVGKSIFEARIKELKRLLGEE